MKRCTGESDEMALVDLVKPAIEPRHPAHTAEIQGGEGDIVPRPNTGLDIIIDFHTTSRRALAQFVSQYLGHSMVATAIIAGQDGDVQARRMSCHRDLFLLA